MYIYISLRMTNVASRATACSLVLCDLCVSLRGFHFKPVVESTSNVTRSPERGPHSIVSLLRLRLSTVRKHTNYSFIGYSNHVSIIKDFVKVLVS